MKHCSKEEEKGDEEVNNPGENETSEQPLVVQVHPVEAFGHCLGHLSVPVVLNQPPLDRFVHIVPRAGVDQEEDGGEDDGKCEHKREDSCPKYKSPTRVVTTVTTHSIFNFASHPAHPQSQAGLFQTGSQEKAQLPMVVDPGAAGVHMSERS